MRGADLTVHHGTGYYEREKPRYMEHDIETGTIGKLTREGKCYNFDPPVEYTVRRVYGWAGPMYQAETDDRRVGAGDDDMWLGKVRRNPKRGAHCGTAKGSVTSLRLECGRDIEANFGWSHKDYYSGPDISTVSVTEIPPRAEGKRIDRVAISTALFWATHNHCCDTDWGYSYEEVTISPGRIDVVRTQGPHSLLGYEIKSCRADFTADRKWQKYLPYCHIFSFVTTEGSIKPEELPPGIGLYFLNPSYRPMGGERRKPDEMPLRRIVPPKYRDVEIKYKLAMAETMLRKGGPVNMTDRTDKLLKALQVIA